MSADSPRRGVHKGAQVISPQPIVDRSIIDSVAGIINDIVPQAYAGTPNSDNKESISWARFEYADVNDPALYPDYNEGSSTPPLLLVLGYATGVQVWLISATGEATEVLSWRQGVVRTLRILPNPKTDEEHVDPFDSKRPMVAICDSAGPGPQFCNISFISLKTGEQAKSIKFKNPVCDILANRRSVLVTFLEKIAVFDARTLEDVLTVTTCYDSPGPNPNPVALGTRWLAYSEKKLLPAKRSSGGCEGEGVQSYTATVLYAAKSLGKGLRGLGETVASSLTGNSVSPVVLNNTGGDVTQPGVITILDLQAAKEEKELDDANIETVIAHFTAHSDAIVAMTFDLSGALLMTADKRGHDFHVFRIQPHPGGPTLAAVHHLYILHRGDTTAKVQDMVFSSDTRWAAISTVRGTTHVFPVAPYGGPVGVRTHSTPHVVNRLSRFHRSAGLMDDGTRSHSPVPHTELPLSVYPYSNPRLPPYPHPTVLHPLAQIRQPSKLNHANSQVQQSRPQQRQRLHSDDSGTLPLKICACFAPPRAWMYAQRESTAKVIKRAVDSLFIMACHGNMIQYDLEPKPAAGVPKEKVCDDTMIELEVEAKGQWPLLRSPNSLEIVPPLLTSSPLLCVTTIPKDIQDVDLAEDRWLSQVEIVTHAGPHRRLWMGPQFVFKTYNATSGVAVNLVEAEAIEIGVTGGSRPARSNPVNMPHAASRSLVPVVIDGSGSSYEQSPRFMEAYGDSLDSENVGVGSGENQLREDLAEAMLETSIAPHRAPGRRLVFERVGHPITKVVNPLGTVITVSADEEDINSSLEFDIAEENHVPDPPRSVCAEEGPASLGDLEPESQTLRDLTEICAEMRSASDSAIDRVSDENICEVKERKSLCVEMAALTNPSSSSIDFEKEEAFRDVPTNLSLCVEKGEIPSSPMTQAKETAWCKGFGKREDTGAHERNLSEARYVVNCEEDTVVLMKNKLSQGRTSATTQFKEGSSKKLCESDKLKKSGKNSSTAEVVTTRGETRPLGKKYILKENEDSIVIEGCENSGNGDGRSKNIERKVGENLKGIGTGKSKNKSKSSTAQDSSCKNVKTELSTENKSLEKRVQPIAEVQELEAIIDEDTSKNGESNSMEDAEVVVDVLEKCKAPSLEAPDDFSSSEYHIVDTACCNKDAALNQSDDDIEHIQSSEITQMEQSECMDNYKCIDVSSCAESSPIMQRKNSKHTISDDDLEYIHRSELTEIPDVMCEEDLKLDNIEKEADCDSRASTRNSKRTASSDDDLEHIQHSDVCTLVSETLIDSTEKSAKKPKESSTDQAVKSKSTKKTKDIVVIESDTSAADVTVIFKPLEGWNKNKNADKETTDEPVKDSPSRDNPSPLRKAKTRVSPVVAPKRSQGSIEIIDIDAMQKAEMEISTDVTTTPECKILSGPVVCGTRIKRYRKNKKYHPEGNVQNPAESSGVSTKTVDETLNTEGSTQEHAPVSWSAVVKRKSPPPAELEEREESEKQVLAEEKLDPKDNPKCNPATEKLKSERKGVRSSPLEQNTDTESTNSENARESLFRSSVVIDQLRDAVTELDDPEPLAQEAELSWNSITDLYDQEPSGQPAESSWSSIVKKKTLTSSEADDNRKKPESEPLIEEPKEPSITAEKKKVRRKHCYSSESTSNYKTKLSASKSPENPISESPDECVVLNIPNSPPNGTAEREKRSEESSPKLEVLNEIVEEVNDELTKAYQDQAPVDSTFSKEDSFEPEKDPEPEKRNDSEVEIVPERSSSSDELNANVAFMNAEDYSSREAVGKDANGTNSTACATGKKSNRSKKKKRR